MKVAATASFLLILPAAFTQPSSDLARRFDAAERRIVRLAPTVYPALPAAITHELQRRGCAIPQTLYRKKPHNVIRGEFAKPGQTDWAVLCSINGVSSILVFWNGIAANPAVLAPLQDRNFLQTIDSTDPGFSRLITPVGRDFITRHYDAYGGTKPPPLDHQGIDDAFVEKASVVWYLYGGKWLKLTGAD